jgi:hypothetical protein
VASDKAGYMGVSGCFVGYNGHASFEIVGDGGEANLESGLSQSAPSHPVQSVAALGSAEDFLDPAAHTVDPTVPRPELT